MNAARAAAGLAGFEKASKEGQVLPEDSSEGRQIVASDLWNEICQNLVGVSRAAGSVSLQVLEHLAN